MLMKRNLISTIFAIAAGTISLVATEPQPHTGKECSLTTIRGTYLLKARLDSPGYAPVPGVPQVVGGLRTFDGAGSISGIATVNAGGTVAQNVQAAGVYTMNQNCTGTMTNAGMRHYDIYVAPDGSEVIGVRTDSGVVEILTLKRVTPPG